MEWDCGIRLWVFVGHVGKADKVLGTTGIEGGCVFYLGLSMKILWAGEGGAEGWWEQWLGGTSLLSR